MKTGRKDEMESFLFGGRPVVGWSINLLLDALSLSHDRIIVANDNPLLRADLRSSDGRLQVDAGSVAGRAAGLALSGVRAGGLVVNSDLGSRGGGLALAARMHVPLTLVSTVDAATPSPASFNGFWSQTQLGTLGLIAGNVQESIDFALVATRISEQVLLPTLCASDCIRSKWDVASVFDHEPELIEAFLGRPEDVVASPTPAQTIALGSERRRIPVLLSQEMPAGLNPSYGSNSEYLAAAGDAAFFRSHAAVFARDAFDEFGSLTGRFYTAVETYRSEDAEFLLLAVGSAGSRLLASIDALRSSTRLKVGGVRILVAAPFPDEELRAVLGGKAAVTVLEEADSIGALSNAVRAGAKPEGPVIHTMHVSNGNEPTLADWRAALGHMSKISAKPRTFFVVPQPDGGRSRIPGLERTDQLIRKSYPEAPWIAADPPPDGSHQPPAVHVFSKEPVLLGETLGTFARTYSSFVGVALAGHLAKSHPSEYVLSLKPSSPLIVVFDGEVLGADVVLRELVNQATVVVPFTGDRKQFWSTVPEVFRLAAVGRNLSVFPVSAPHFNQETPGELSQHVGVFSLLGGLLRCLADGSVPHDAFGDALLRTLVQDGLPTSSAERLLQAFTEGFHSAQRISHSDAPERTASTPETPWTLRGLRATQGSLLDPARFWNSVGFEVSVGRSDLLAPDPHLACRVVPGNTSVAGDLKVGDVPGWVPENCSGCGLCWTYCPHSALPASAFDPEQLLQIGKSRIEARAGSTTQITRLGKAFAKRLHKLVSDDKLHRFTTAQGLLEEAAAQLLESAKLDEDTETLARIEFDELTKEIGALGIARTETLFDSLKDDGRSSGLLLSIAVDTDACTGCGICSEICPDDAMDRVPLAATPAARSRIARRLVHEIEATNSHLVEPESELPRRIMNKTAYYATVGGGRAEPGSGLRMALHLIAGLAESNYQSRRNTLESELDALENRLKESIQKTLAKTTQINDFNEFASRIRERSRIEGKLEIFDLVGGSGIDTERLERLSRALLDVEDMRRRYSGDNLRLSGFVAVFGDSPGLLEDAAFPLNPFRFPWISADAGNAADLARGISDGLTRTALDAAVSLRRARLISDDSYDPAEDVQLGVDDLTEVESALLPHVCLFTESLTGELLASLKGGSPIRVFWLDRLDEISIAESPLRLGWNPDLVYAQTVPSAAGHFLSAVDTALSSRSTSLTRVYTPAPRGQGFSPSDTVRRMEAAVKTRVFPLITYDPSPSLEWNERWSLEGNPAVTADWPLNESGMPETAADWFAVEGRFARHFETLRTGSTDDRDAPLAEFLARTDERQDELRPYVELADASGKMRRLRISAALVRDTQRVLSSWRLMQELASVRSNLLALVRQEVEGEILERLDVEKAESEARLNARLQELRSGYEAELRGRLETRLLEMSGFAETSETLAGWLESVERMGRTKKVDSASRPGEGGDG